MSWFSHPIRKLREMVAVSKPDIHPELAVKVKKIIYALKEQGHTCDVHMGYRSIDQQNQLYNKLVNGKRVTNARGGQSWHNYGLAVDIVFKDSKGNWSWAETHPWKLLGEIGKSHGLKWGGDFTRLKDRPHFEMQGIMTISQARDAYLKGGILAVWKEWEVVNKK